MALGLRSFEAKLQPMTNTPVESYIDALLKDVEAAPTGKRALLVTRAYTAGGLATPDDVYNLEKALKLFELAPDLKKEAWRLPERAVIYRGVAAINESQLESRVRRVSWTPQHWFAVLLSYGWAAHTHRAPRYLARAVITANDALAVWSYVFALEVIVDPRGLNYEVVKL